MEDPGLKAVRHQRVIFHIDLNAFYPSVEVVCNPVLRGKPLIVGADPKRGRGRGVVVSCSYEARKLGVRSGMPISRAFMLAPNAEYVRPNFPVYGKVSKRVMELLRTYADNFEQVSIDEAFLDVSDRVEGNYDAARELAILIKTDLEAKEELLCSIGIAPNKSSAKIASEFQKPDGLTVVHPGEVRAFLTPLPVSSISGVGKKTENFLRSIGVRTIGDLQEVPGKQLVKYFGKTGVWLWGVANGLEQIEVKERPMRSLSAEHTFEQDVADKGSVFAKLEELARRLHGRVLSSRLEFRVVGIKIRFSHFQTYTRENTLPVYTTNLETMLQEAKNLFREFENNRRKVRLIGIFVADFREVVDSGQNEMILSQE
ncbi:MAG TPA: DNA polymerase IV [Nitrososphaerales archaeon]|nr:DNA polymerase IV [Nitrososphaerales archaeon]